MAYKWTVDVPIPAGASGLSGVCDFSGGATRMGVIVPATWVAAGLSFMVSTSAGGTFVDLKNEAGTLLSIAVAASDAKSLETSAPILSTFRWVKVRSGTAATPVNQTGAPTLTFTFQR